MPDQTPDQLRERAAEIMLDHARDVERISIREHLEEQGLDSRDNVTVSAIQELISTADITIAWPGLDDGAELARLYDTYAHLAQQEAVAGEDPFHPVGEDHVLAHRRPGPVQDAYQAYRQRLHAIAETGDSDLADLIEALRARIADPGAHLPREYDDDPYDPEGETIYETHPTWAARAIAAGLTDGTLGYVPAADLAEAYDVLAAVNGLHQPDTNSDGHEWCRPCRALWPCRTTQVIEGLAPVPGSSTRAQEHASPAVTVAEIRAAIRRGVDAYPGSISEGMDAAAVTVARLFAADRDPEHPLSSEEASRRVTAPECDHQAGCPAHGDVRDCEPMDRSEA